MSAARHARRSAGNSSGAVLVFVALMLPVLIGGAGVAIDVGNWFAHKRHLQVQADAGALAGAGIFEVPCDAARSAAIRNEAAKYSSVEYSGPGYTPGPGFNPQIGGTDQAHMRRLINSKTFYNQPAPADDTAEGEPCVAKMIDVKLTETDLPWFLDVASVKYINAHARVEIKKKVTSTHSLPVGVPEIGPKKVKAMFVNEKTGAVIASTDLVAAGSFDGLSIWSNSAAPVPVTVNTADIGVRIALSGSTSTSCGDPLVDCFGAGTSTAIVAGRPGLVHVRGWSNPPGGTATAPQVGDVDLLLATCEDGYFTARATADPCTVDVRAAVDFGGTPPTLGTTRILALRSGAQASTANELVAPSTWAGVWTGGAVPVARGSGAAGIELRWQTGCPTDRTASCKQPTAEGSLGTVQRAFAGSESLAVSGPIKLLQLFKGAVSGANSFAACSTCTHDLVVKLGLKPNLQLAQSFKDLPVPLKLAGGGSQNQSLDCDPALPSLREELANGCGPSYTVNDGSAPCPSNLTGVAQPWPCVAVATGAKIGQVTQGMNLRILGDANANVCTKPNNWASYWTAAGLTQGDPRIIEVFLTPFGAFTGSGSGTVPVTGFATFYVTGWDGGACQGNGDDLAGQGAIVGHYIKTIDTINGGGGGEEFCDFNALGSCVADFTR